ncbi:hypothetical protein BC829DRAFT_431248 [Chytridium lagenaria]|nr:hypothetical protein BC829DRAFT_431248 [Chytridium lagenaria]
MLKATRQDTLGLWKDHLMRTDLEVHVISDLLGVIVEMHQIQDGTPKSRLVILHPTTTAAEDECANGDARVTMCAVGAGSLKGGSGFDHTNSKEREKARGTNDSSDDDLKMAIMLSLQDASSLPPLHPTTKPFAATTSTTSIASGSSASKPKLDSLLKVAGCAGGVVRESKRVEQPEKLRTGVDGFVGGGGYDEDEALRAAIEASRREMEVTAEEEDGEVSTKRWKGKERA